MSSEQSVNIKSLDNQNIQSSIDNTHNDLPNRVDINDLLSKVREKEKSQKKENLLFFGLIGVLIAVTGIIASL